MKEFFKRAHKQKDHDPFGPVVTEWAAKRGIERRPGESTTALIARAIDAPFAIVGRVMIETGTRMQDQKRWQDALSTGIKVRDFGKNLVQDTLREMGLNQEPFADDLVQCFSFICLRLVGPALGEI